MTKKHGRRSSKKKGKHGGWRPNAGAKAKLEFEDRLEVGRWCEDEWRRQHVAACDERLAQDPRLDVYLSYVRDASYILKAKTSEERQERHAEHSKAIAEELPRAKLALSKRQPRLKGVRGPIIQAAFGHFRPTCLGLTPSAVDDSWKWYRGYVKECLEDLDTPNPNNAHLSDET